METWLKTRVPVGAQIRQREWRQLQGDTSNCSMHDTRPTTACKPCQQHQMLHLPHSLCRTRCLTDLCHTTSTTTHHRAPLCTTSKLEIHALIPQTRQC